MSGWHSVSRLLCAAACVWLLTPGSLGAQTADTSGAGVAPSIEQQIVALRAEVTRLQRELSDARLPTEETSLDRRLAELGAQLERLAQLLEARSAPRPAPPAGTSVVASANGLTVRTVEGDVEFRMRGYIQFDGRFYEHDLDAQMSDAFLVRRARPVFEASAKKFLLRVMPDFADSKLLLQDAYVDLRFAPTASVRAGRFKVPFGLERLMSAVDTLFVERAYPTALAPNRDIGAMVYGDVGRGRLAYAAGVFNGVPDGSSIDAEDGDGKDVAGRVFVQPITGRARDVWGVLGLGAAATVGRQDGTLSATGLPAHRTPGQQVFLRYAADSTAAGTTLANGDRRRWTAQGYWYRDNVGLLWEHVRTSQDVRRGTGEGTARFRASQLAGSVVVTGEPMTFRSVVPRRPFGSGFGALELTGRYTTLRRVDSLASLGAFSGTSAGEARTWTAGVNWYLTRNLKVVLDYEHTAFEGGRVTGDRTSERNLLMRTQLNF